MTDFACRLHAAHDLRIEDQPEPQPAPGDALIRVLRGGICGSDLHYYHDGGFGPVRVREPMILGHEAAGVVETAPAGSGLRTGQLVALIDEAGYLRADLAELAAQLGVPLALVETVLAGIQCFDPSGVGARDLAECIAIQALEADRY
ncbi:MAG: hypothetical protein COB97_02595, partial [Paracoccus sp.]